MRLHAILLGGLLAGCTAAPPPAGAQFDGTYVGQNSLVRGGGYPCEPASEPFSVTVRDGRFEYPFPMNLGRTAPVPVQVAADGTFAGQLLYAGQNYMVKPLSQNTWVTVHGRIADGALDATITDDRCTHQLTAHRS